MEKQALDQLLKKYYDGKSSADEEDQMAQLLKSSDDPEYKADRVIAEFVETNMEMNAPAGFEEKVMGDIDNETSNTRSVRLWPLLSGIAASILFGVLIFSIIYNQPSKVITTADQKAVTLSDGSRVTLNRNSELAFAKSFGDSERLVSLSGEAFFEVTPDPEKPFVITSGNSKVQVLGTAFSIRNYEIDTEIIVSVTSGRVGFSSLDGAAAVELEKNETGTLVKKTNGISITDRPRANSLSWKTRELTFNDQKMTEVIPDLEHYFDISIKLENEDLLQCHFRGSFKDPTLKDVIEVLEYSLNLSFEYDGKQYILKGSGCSSHEL